MILSQKTSSVNFDTITHITHITPTAHSDCMTKENYHCKLRYHENEILLYNLGTIASDTMTHELLLLTLML